MSRPVFWLRCEKKEFERRAALTPNTAKKLIDAGFEIFVERDEQRIFRDYEYEALVYITSSMGIIFNNYIASAASSLKIIRGPLPRLPFPSLA